MSYFYDRNNKRYNDFKITISNKENENKNNLEKLKHHQSKITELQNEIKVLNPEVELLLKQAEEKTELVPKETVKKDTELIIFGESSDRIMYTLANCCKHSDNKVRETPHTAAIWSCDRLMSTASSG